MPAGRRQRGRQRDVHVDDRRPGNTTQTYGDYYDSNCQQTERIATLVFPAGSGATGSVTGTTTEYDRTGAVTVYATVQATYDRTSVTVQTADARTVGGPIVGRSGATCVATSNTAATCSIASFATVAGVTSGATETVSESFTVAGSSTAVSAQLTGTTYTGSGLALVPPGSGSTTWGLTGGTQLDSITGTGNATYNGSIVTSASYSITDTTANISASGGISGSSLTLTLTQAGATIATVTIDADGNGSITYSDNTREVVAGFTIVG